ncbi:PREDICTED: uncharacterized protein LOC106814051 [Priapulus caudatus]|uniref:Uncharacterized protein LOC106814051 n=1 Tax=Priapulus caudatus TaxID=37621 RepID=A0ABM1ENN4_PRICU|nr:PREDICTED: uncharacterized protein LOC106814051 [Priapulus caudatus]
MFGGKVNSAPDSFTSVYANDLWRYKNSSWVLMHPGNAHNVSGSQVEAPPSSANSAMCVKPGSRTVVFTPSTVDSSHTWIFNMASARWQPADSVVRENATMSDKKIAATAKKEPKDDELAENDTGDKEPLSSGTTVSTSGPKMHYEEPPLRQSLLWWCKKDEMWIYGGENAAGEILSDLWIFSLDNLRWTKMGATKELVNTNGATMWEKSNEVLIYEGSSPSAVLWSLNTTSVQLRQMNQNGELSLHVGMVIHKPPRRLFAMGWVTDNGDLLLYGGQDLTAAGSPLLGDIWVFETADLVWQRMVPVTTGTVQYGQRNVTSIFNFPGPRARGATWTHDGDMMLLGGVGNSDGDGDALLDDLWMLRLKSIDDLFTVAAKVTSSNMSSSKGYGIFFGTSIAIFAAFALGIFLQKCIRWPVKYGGSRRRKMTREEYYRVVDS